MVWVSNAAWFLAGFFSAWFIVSAFNRLPQKPRAIWFHFRAGERFTACTRKGMQLTVDGGKIVVWDLRATEWKMGAKP